MALYIAGTTPSLTHRVTEIAASLAAHPTIECFVIFDDEAFDKLGEYFPDNFVHCPDQIGEKEYEKADQILAWERVNNNSSLLGRFVLPQTTIFLRE